MNTKQIDNFLALYRLRSVRRTAEILYLSQQALSRSIRELERELGTTLFSRDHQGMQPTRAGEYFYEKVAPLNKRFIEVCSNVASIREDTYEIEVPCAFGTLNLLYSYIKSFMMEKHVHVRWEEVSDRTTEERVLAAHQPLGISVRNRLDQGLEFLTLGKQPIVAMVPKDDPLAQQRSIRCSELNGRPIIIEGPQFNVNQIFVEQCLACGFSPNIAIETTEISLCIRLSSMGEGIAIVPDFIARQGAREHVKILPFTEDLVWEFGLIWRKDTQPKGPYADFVQWLSAQCDGALSQSL